jgi:hypothetical protein
LAAAFAQQAAVILHRDYGARLIAEKLRWSRKRYAGRANVKSVAARHGR